jgi:hypothetical protein
MTGDNQAIEIHPDVAPQPDDIIITKKRVSAFAGSDLDIVLRAGGIDHLVLTGIATSGVVLSTLRQAADLDFNLTVLTDGCLDSDPEVHRVLTEKVFPRQAEVITVADWIAASRISCRPLRRYSFANSSIMGHKPAMRRYQAAVSDAVRSRQIQFPVEVDQDLLPEATHVRVTAAFNAAPTTTPPRQPHRDDLPLPQRAYSVTNPPIET